MMLMLTGTRDSCGIIDVNLTQFSAEYEKKTCHVASLVLQLSSLSVLDLLRVRVFFRMLHECLGIS